MDNSTFKTSLKVKSNSFENTLRYKCNKLRYNPKYTDFTNQFILAVGSAIDKNFPGVSFDFKARTKSLASTNKKIEKMCRLHDENVKENLGMPDDHFKIYDTIGGKIVPFYIDDNFHSDYLCIDGYLARRSKAYEILQNSINSLKEFEENSSGIENFELIHTLKKEIVASYRKNYHLCDYICQNKVAEGIYNYIKNDQDLKNNFGLYISHKRDKDFNTSEEYIAKHITFGSKNLPDWFIELQFKSHIDYMCARNGPSAHYNRNGKQRIIPENIEEINVDCVPTYVVYKSPTELYKAGAFENIYHYYQDQLDNEHLQKLIKSSYGKDHGEYLKFPKSEKRNDMIR